MFIFVGFRDVFIIIIYIFFLCFVCCCFCVVVFFSFFLSFYNLFSLSFLFRPVMTLMVDWTGVKYQGPILHLQCNWLVNMAFATKSLKRNANNRYAVARLTSICYGD